MQKSRHIFADKATLVLRTMLSDPQRHWVARDFDVSLGLAQGVLETMARLGYVERVIQGPKSFTTLVNKQALLNDWLKAYQFELNEVKTYYSPDKNILPAIKECLKGKQYALTLHTGANLITSFVRTDHVYLYLSAANWPEEILNIRQKLGLKELVRGGNVHLIRPYYKKSAFHNVQAIGGYQVVSSLQLYLDLYNFMPRGQEHAEYLAKELLEKKKNFYEF